MSQKTELDHIQEGCSAFFNNEPVEVIERYNHYIWLIRLDNRQIIMAYENDLKDFFVYE